MKRILAIIWFLFMGISLSAQTVTNARFVQNGNFVSIYYDLLGDSDISIFVSTDGGVSFDSIPMVHISGAVGRNVSSGTGRCAVWDVLSDKENLNGNNICFKVIATLDAEKSNERGDDYFFGRGVPQDYREAAKWYKMAAEKGNPIGQYNLGKMCMKGVGVRQDYDEALELYKKSAEQGYALAQYTLGHLYYDTQEYEKSLKWYLKSAEQGNSRAQCNLGYIYEIGIGVQQNYMEAVKWYLKSAEQGNAVAQFNLGNMYEYGKGVEKNIEEALIWYTKAANQGYKGAIQRMNSIEKSSNRFH